MRELIYKNFLKFALSVQEREVTIQLAKILRSSYNSFEIKDVRDKVEIEQHSHLSAIITRLVTKGVLKRLDRGKYEFSDIDLVKYIKSKE